MPGSNGKYTAPQPYIQGYFTEYSATDSYSVRFQGHI